MSWLARSVTWMRLISEFQDLVKTVDGVVPRFVRVDRRHKVSPPLNISRQ